MARKRNDPTRLESFSDGVFALSATLLVVTLEVPASFSDLLENIVGFGAFAITFAALIVLWSIHNAYFRRYGLQDGVTVALNACLLFVVLYYVFPLKFLAAGFVNHVLGAEMASTMPMIGSFSELRLVYVLYSVGFTLLFLVMSLMYRHARRCAATLQLDPGEVHDAILWQRHYALFALVGVLSIAMAWFSLGLTWGLPGIVYALLGPLCWGHATWHNRRAPVSTDGGQSAASQTDSP